jgi:hypothetical protein
MLKHDRRTRLCRCAGGAQFAAAWKSGSSGLPNAAE